MNKLESIKARTAIDQSTGCWLWQGGKTGNGYGAVRLHGKAMPVHRAAYELARGPIASGHVVRHKCDTPLCCNPDHLTEGTHADNIMDKVSRGRARGNESRGGDHPNAILTDGNVVEIIGLIRGGLTLTEIGRRFGVSRATVSGIAARRSWRHIPR